MRVSVPKIYLGPWLSALSNTMTSHPSWSAGGVWDMPVLVRFMVRARGFVVVSAIRQMVARLALRYRGLSDLHARVTHSRK